MMDWYKISPHLAAKLDPANVKPAPKGKFGDYVDGHHVVSEANRIFGFGGWSYEITRLSEASRIETGAGQVRVSYLCTVKVHVGDTFKEGSAVGMGAGKPDNLGDVIESAVKEAETDALKRALRTYGNTFGLALYDKTQADVGVEPDVNEVQSAIDAIASIKDLPAFAAWWKGLNANAPHIAAVPAVIKAKDKRKTELTPKDKEA